MQDQKQQQQQKTASTIALNRGNTGSRKRLNYQTVSRPSHILHRKSKKGATLTMAITLSILGGFAKFFHYCKKP